MNRREQCLPGKGSLICLEGWRFCTKRNQNKSQSQWPDLQLANPNRLRRVAASAESGLKKVLDWKRGRPRRCQLPAQIKTQPQMQQQVCSLKSYNIQKMKLKHFIWVFMLPKKYNNNVFLSQWLGTELVGVLGKSKSPKKKSLTHLKNMPQTAGKKSKMISQ